MLQNPSPWLAIRRYLSERDVPALVSLLDGMSAADRTHALARLDNRERLALIRQLPNEIAAEVLDSLPNAYVTDVLERMEAEEASDIVATLPNDEQAEMLNGVADAERDAILRELDPHSAAETSALLEYAAGTAGSLMTLNYLRHVATATVTEVLHRLTDPQADLSRYVQSVAYVVSSNGRLWGAVRTQHLVGTSANTPLRSLARVSPAVNVHADLATMANIFSTTEELALPVTGDDGSLLGVITRDRLDEALAERAAEEHLKSQGILTEELRSMPVLQRSRRRLSWLSVNIGLNIMAASIIAMFEDTLTAVIALAVFLPIVSDMSGCSGNQAVAVSMRELTLGIARPRDVGRVWWQEIKVGLLNGLALGALLGLAAFAWKGNLLLGAVVAVALSVNTLVAVSIGGCIPLLLQRWQIDPAVASGPVLTTVTDMCGFFLVLGLATLVLPWL